MHASQPYDQGFDLGKVGSSPDPRAFTDALDMSLYLSGWTDGNREYRQETATELTSRMLASLRSGSASRAVAS